MLCIYVLLQLLCMYVKFGVHICSKSTCKLQMLVCDRMGCKYEKTIDILYKCFKQMLSFFFSSKGMR
ncbi:hypothetical protein GDO78_012651 [Eleutherodactylus coqui]|uniref:Secreted protein n=1 Tax=Eleutherodactylus coqui TaxID=57060 RepID=A0A8J6K570_ELECQ|nr:hypothetical protein GDO78_012651 [Eleutherodactylus coqui]